MGAPIKTFERGEQLYHRETGVPGKYIRVVGDVVTIEVMEGGKRVERAYPADELETFAERNERLEEEAAKNRGAPFGPPKRG